MATIEERLRADGKKTYFVKVRVRGYKAECATFEKVTLAKQWIQTTESQMREGRYVQNILAKRKTVGDLLKRYKEYLKRDRPQTAQARTHQLTWWEEQLGKKLIVDLRPADIAECRDILLSEKISGRKNELRTNSTVVRYIATLSHAFSVAIKEWHWLESNPVMKIEKPKEARGRQRYLNDEERIKLLEVCKKSEQKALYPIVSLLLATGTRKSEVLNLTWKDVDLVRGRLTLWQTKNGDPRIVPVPPPVIQLLKEWSKIRRVDSNLVFPGANPLNPIDIKKSWMSALREAEIKNFRLHDLRHSAASYLLSSGCTLEVVGQILGHRSYQTTKRYAHLEPRVAEAAVEKVGRRIWGG